MKVNDVFFQVTSEDPERLKVFYRDVVGLTPRPEMGEGAFAVGRAVLGIDGHSEVQGPAKEPQRMFVDLFVDDVKAEREQLEAKGVRFIRKEGKEPWGGVISTFVDPDGNYCQLIEYKPQ